MEVWRACRHVGREVWTCGRVERDSMLWRGSKLWRRQEALEVVKISGGGWRRSKALDEVSEALEEVESSGGSKHEALEAALEAEGQRCGGSEKVWK